VSTAQLFCSLICYFIRFTSFFHDCKSPSPFGENFEPRRPSVYAKFVLDHSELGCSLMTIKVQDNRFCWPSCNRNFRQLIMVLNQPASELLIIFAQYVPNLRKKAIGAKPWKVYAFD